MLYRSSAFHHITDAEKRYEPPRNLTHNSSFKTDCHGSAPQQLFACLVDSKTDGGESPLGGRPGVGSLDLTMRGEGGVPKALSVVPLPDRNEPIS